MNFDRRHRPSNRPENDNKWTDRSDNRARDNFGNRRRDQNIGSNFRVQENSFDNSVRSRDQNFGSDFQKREYFNEFTDQGREQKFGSDFRMRDNSNDYFNQSHNNLGNNNRMRDSSRDFFNTGRDNNFRSDDQIPDFTSHGRFNDLGSDNHMRKSFNDFHNQGYNTNLGTNDRTRESVHFGNQRRGNNLPNDDRMPENFNEFGYGNRDNIRQSTFDNKARDNDEMFRTYLQGTKIQNTKRCNDNYLSAKPEISSQNTSINYTKLQEGPKDFVFSKLSNQQKPADINKPEIKIEKTESDVVRATPSKNIDIKMIANGLNDNIAVNLLDKSEMTKSARRKLNKQAWIAKCKEAKKLKFAIIRQHKEVYLDKKREMDNTEDADEDQGKLTNLCLIIKDRGHKTSQIAKQKQDWFEKALRDKIGNFRRGARRPIFTFAAFIDGVYRLTCADEFTYGWVRANVPRLQLWTKANLKVVPDSMMAIRYILPSPKPSIDFEPISEKDLNADLVNRNSIRGKIVMTNQLKIKHAISGLIPIGSHLPYNFTRTSQGTLSVECKDLTSLQWLYDHLSVLDGLWPNADLRLIQRRTLSHFRKITFTLKQIVRTPFEVITLIVHDNDTLHIGLWRPLKLHPDGRTLSFAIDEESVKDLEALGSRIKYMGDTIDVKIHPRQESQAKSNIDSPSVIQEIDHYELNQIGIADVFDAEDNASATTDDN